MWYLDVRSEVRTRHQLGRRARERQDGSSCPYCTVDEQGANKLGLWHLTSMDELVVGKWKILEPPRERWGEPGKEVDPRELDLVMVPGVGFSRDGARMGNGQGYYDRLLDQRAAGRAARRAGLRMPVVSELSSAARRLHGQGRHRAGGLHGPRAARARLDDDARAPQSTTPTPRRSAASTPRS